MVAYPDDAAAFLLGLGDLSPGGEPARRSWKEHVASGGWPEFAPLLSGVGFTYGDTSTCEPFRFWALEVSRYSFTTGQQVFARFGAGGGSQQPRWRRGSDMERVWTEMRARRGKRRRPGSEPRASHRRRLANEAAPRPGAGSA